jgi:probable HAF family extracellular repeat protein
MQDLGTLGGPSSGAYGINLSGEVVGISDTLTSYSGFTWTEATGMRTMNLGFTVALGVNDNGESVGYWSPSATESGILWTRAKGVQNLNSIVTNGPRVEVANAINKVGKIAASGSNYHALFLTPISN